MADEATAPSAGAPDATGVATDSQSALSNNKEAIFQEMERLMAGEAPAGAAAETEEPYTPPPGTDPAVPEPPAVEAATPPAEVAPDAAAEAAANAPAELEKIRQALGKANLDVNVKKALLDSHYRDRAYAESGFKVEHARALHDIGFTPDRALRLAHLFPSEEIEQATVAQAHGFQQVMDDLRGDPTNFLVKLSKTDSDATRAIIDTIVDNVETLRPERYNAQYNEFARRLFDTIESTAASGEDEDFKEAVAIVAARVFPGRGKPGGAAGARGPVDPAIEAIRRENEQFRAREQQAREAQERSQVDLRTRFVNDAQGAAVKHVSDEIRRMVDTKAASIPVETRGEIAELIFRDVYAAATANATVMRQIQAVINGAPLTQQGFNQAVQYAVKVAAGYIPPAAAQRITRWTNGAAPGRPAASTAAPVAAARAASVPVPGNVTTTAQPKPATAIAFPQGKAPMDKQGWYDAFDALGPPQMAARR